MIPSSALRSVQSQVVSIMIFSLICISVSNIAAAATMLHAALIKTMHLLMVNSWSGEFHAKLHLLNM